MPEYVFTPTRVLTYKNRILGSILKQENVGQWKPVFSHIFVVFTKNLSSWYDGLPTMEITGVRERSLSETPFFNLYLWLWYKFFQVKTLLSRAYYIHILSSCCRFCVCRFEFSLQLFFWIMIKLTKDVGEDVFLYVCS